MNLPKIDFRRYRLPFRSPLHTAHGLWTERTGLIVRLTDPEGRAGFGEVAPLADFGTETLAQAEAKLREIRKNGPFFPSPSELAATHPATASALAFAMEEARGVTTAPSTLPVAALLPGATDPVPALNHLAGRGFHHVKWKVGATDDKREQGWAADLLTRASELGVKVRLDANGGWTPDSARRWLDWLDATGQPGVLEFVEQPLPPASFDRMLELAASHKTLLALDESVAGLASLKSCEQRGWKGLVVIKPGLLGDLAGFRAWRDTSACGRVYSTVMESEIGLAATARLAAEDTPVRALGLGVRALLRLGPDLPEFEPATRALRDRFWESLE